MHRSFASSIFSNKLKKKKKKPRKTKGPTIAKKRAETRTLEKRSKVKVNVVGPVLVHPKGPLAVLPRALRSSPQHNIIGQGPLAGPICASCRAGHATWERQVSSKSLTSVFQSLSPGPFESHTIPPPPSSSSSSSSFMFLYRYGISFSSSLVSNKSPRRFYRYPVRAFSKLVNCLLLPSPELR